MVADVTSSTDQGGDLVFQTEAGMNLETSQVAALHFELAMFRQQQGTTAKSTYSGGDYPIHADFGENPQATIAQQVSAREDAAIGRYQRGTTSIEQNKQFDPGGRRVTCSFLPSGYFVFCMFCCTFICFVVLKISPVIMPGSKGYKNSPLKMGANGTREPDG